jgi:uncharacterized membrane protein
MKNDYVSLESFIDTYFIKPIQEGTGYNVVNTATYALLFIVFITAVHRFFKKLKIHPDRGLYLALLPMILVGGVMRSLEDAGVLPFSYLTVTPGIYLLVAAVTAIFIILSKRISPHRFNFSLGCLSFGFLLGYVILLRLKYPLEFLAIIISTFIIYRVTLELNERSKLVHLKSIENKLMLFAHILDGFASFFAIAVFPLFTGIHYFEQHVVGGFIMSSFGEWTFIPIKILVALVAIHYVDMEKDKHWKFILKFFVIALGLGPGLRDALRLMMGV